MRVPLRHRSDLTLVCPNLGDGGTQRVVSGLANAWSARGRRVCVITAFEGEDFYELDASVERVALREPFAYTVALRARGVLERLRRRLTGRRGRRRLDSPASRVARAGVCSSLSAIRVSLRRIFLLRLNNPRIVRLRKAIRCSGSPVVVSFLGSTNILAILACRGLDKRLIISERNDPAIQELSTPWQALRPRVYNRADVVTANSRAALATMSSYVDREKLVLVPNPILPPPEGRSAAQEGPSPLPQGPAVIIVARLHPQKAHEVLFEAFARLPSDLEEWRLAVVGQGPREEELRDLAVRLGIDARVDWRGQVRDPYPHYRSAEIFALPSRHEGSPNALLEAMSTGLPCIVSDASGGPLEFVSDARTGLVVGAGDAKALARAIETLARDPALRKQLGEAGRQRMAELSLSDVLDTWESVLGPESARDGA